MNHWILLSTLTLILWGLSGVTQKLATNHISFTRSFQWFVLTFFVQAAAIELLAPQALGISAKLMALAALGGFLNGLGALTTFAALESGGRASIVIPITSLYPLFTILGGWLLLGEVPNRNQVVGLGCALVAVYLFGQETPEAPTEDSRKC